MGLLKRIEEGEVFGKWTAVELTRIVAKTDDNYKKRGQYWMFRCECGLEKEMYASSVTSGRSKSCQSCVLRGKPSRNYKGGSVNKDGYRIIYNPNHPNARVGGQIFEHTVVMSELLGRPLLPNEEVHHVNGDRLDNTPENLELWSTSQPAGQRVEDKVKWAKEILNLYEPESLRWDE